MCVLLTGWVVCAVTWFYFITLFKSPFAVVHFLKLSYDDQICPGK